MNFPYGEWVILFLTFLAWSEKRASRYFFLMLTTAWLIGKSIEMALPVTMPWNWHYARLAVMVVFWVWALKKAKTKIILPLLFTCLVVGLETLFLVNEPGVFPNLKWVFGVILILVAWLSAKSYWGTAAALTGSALFNQAFVRFTYDGIIRYVDLPNDFVWNLGVGLFTVWAGLGLAWEYYTERVRAADAEQVLSNSVVNCEPSKERDL